ncbi:MAG: tetratricopeptide repeat protein [Cyanobacteria bacterium P01_C01_bin.89]
MENFWDQKRKKAFRAALLDTYRSYSVLRIFVDEALEKNLEAIVGSDEGLEVAIYKLVDWADAKKRSQDLYGYFCEENPESEFSQSLESSDRPAADVTSSPTNLSRYRRAIPQFVGRDRDMAQLGECIDSAGTVAIAAAVSGMGGLGKTELAWQWANREYLAGRFPGGVVWLDVAAGNPGEQLILFCQSEFDVELPELPTIAGRVAYCWQHWAEWRSGEVLVVFDDVSRERDAAKIKELQPSGEQFRALWTTRDEWAGIRRYRLDKLDDAAARSLLASYIDEARLEAEPEALEKLLRWFGGLPLGLELAARYLALDDWLTIAEYLGELTLAHESLQENPEMRYPDGVEAAIAISWARLKPETEDGRAARRLAMRLGLFGAAPVPVEWRSAWRKPLQRLVSLNLVERDRDAVVLHPLVRQFVRRQSQEEDKKDLQQDIAQTVMEQGQQIRQAFTVTQLLKCALWIPHLQEVGEGAMLYVEEIKVIRACDLVARFYESRGLYDAAEPWSKRCVEIAQKRLGRDHEETVAAINNLALLYKFQGKYKLAEPLFCEALSIRRQCLPNNHPSLSTSLHNLSALYQTQKKYDSAELLLRESLAIDRETLPKNHPSLAVSLNGLASLYRLQGKHEAAESLCYEALNIDKESLPVGHPHIARDLNNLAAIYESQGKYELAEPLYLESLEISMSSLGEDHPNTKITVENTIDFYQTAIAAGLPDACLRNHPLGDLIRDRLQQSED